MYRLLIVDDEPEIVGWLHALLSEQSHLDLEVLKSYSATEALSELRRWAGTQFDPVVVDHFTRYMTRAMGKTDRLKAAI